MKLTLQEKIKNDLYLTLPELIRATGFGRKAIQKINPPLVLRRCRMSEFIARIKALGSHPTRLTTVGATEPLNGLRSAEDKLRALQTSNDRLGASQLLAESPTHNIA